MAPTALVPTDAEQKRGQASVRLDFDLGEVTAQAYWIPEFRPDKIGVAAIENLPWRSRSFADQYALRLEQSGDFDWAVTYYSGLARTPQVVVTPGGPQRTYLQRQMLGFDMATAIGGYTVRAEVARNWYDDGDNSLLSAGPEWFAVAGIDHEFDAEFYGNMQVILAHSGDRAHCPGGVCAPGLGQVVVANNDFSFTTRKNEIGFSALVGYHDQYQTESYEFSAVYLTQDQGLLLRARAKFRLTDEWRLEVGGDYYAGGHKSVLGAQDDRSGVFAQLTWGF